MKKENERRPEGEKEGDRHYERKRKSVIRRENREDSKQTLRFSHPHLGTMNTTAIRCERGVRGRVIIYSAPYIIPGVDVDRVLGVQTVTTLFIVFGEGSPGGRATAMISILTLWRGTLTYDSRSLASLDRDENVDCEAYEVEKKEEEGIRRRQDRRDPAVPSALPYHY